MDIPTLLYVSGALSLLLIIFLIVTAVRAIWLLQDIRMELRALNDNNKA
jgi:hypothetical protein